jgi:hypothetical protein
MARGGKAWHTQCMVCGVTITNYGSGSPKTLCSRQCRLARMREISKGRYVKKPKRVKTIDKREQTIARHKNIVAAEKQRRGKCAYHLHNFGSELLVTHDLLAVFEFDHVDPARKHQPSKKRGGGVARMIGRVTDEQLIAEMAKCELTCCNCHRLKTIANRDWVYASEKEHKSSQLVLQFT